MVHNPGGDDCILGGGTTQVMIIHDRSIPGDVVRNQNQVRDENAKAMLKTLPVELQVAGDDGA